MHSRKLLLLTGAALITVGACSKKDAVTTDTATAMTIDSSSTGAGIRDSAIIQDSIRIDSIRRADSIRIIDTLNQPPVPDR